MCINQRLYELRLLFRHMLFSLTSRAQDRVSSLSTIVATRQLSYYRQVRSTKAQVRGYVLTPSLSLKDRT